MSLSTVQPDTLQNPQMMQRTTARIVQGGSLIDKPSAFQNFMLGLKKFGSIFARIGAGFMQLWPGIGTIASSALYGVSNLAEGAYQKQVNNRMQQMAADEQAATANFEMITPGFGMFGSPEGVGNAYPSDGLGPAKLDTVLSRETAARTEIENFSVPS